MILSSGHGLARPRRRYTIAVVEYCGQAVLCLPFSNTHCRVKSARSACPDFSVERLQLLEGFESIAMNARYLPGSGFDNCGDSTHGRHRGSNILEDPAGLCTQ